MPTPTTSAVRSACWSARRPMPPSTKFPQGDLDTAKAYGQRVAAIAARLRG